MGIRDCLIGPLHVLTYQGRISTRLLSDLITVNSAFGFDQGLEDSQVKSDLNCAFLQLL